MQAWIIGITAVLSAFLRFPSAFPYLIFDPTSSHPQVVLDTVTTAGSLFKLNFRVQFATSAPFMLTYILFLSSLLFFITQKFTPTFWLTHHQWIFHACDLWIQRWSGWHLFNLSGGTERICGHRRTGVGGGGWQFEKGKQVTARGIDGNDGQIWQIWLRWWTGEGGGFFCCLSERWHQWVKWLEGTNMFQDSPCCWVSPEVLHKRKENHI